MRIACPKGSYYCFNLASPQFIFSLFEYRPICGQPFPSDAAPSGPAHPTPPPSPLVVSSSSNHTPSGPAHSPLPAPYVFSSSSNHTQASRSRWLVGSSRSSMKGRMKRALGDRKGEGPPEPNGCYTGKNYLACYLHFWAGLA